jgi:hypothetical protein
MTPLCLLLLHGEESAVCCGSTYVMGCGNMVSYSKDDAWCVPGMTHQVSEVVPTAVSTFDVKGATVTLDLWGAVWLIPYASCFL